MPDRPFESMARSGNVDHRQPKGKGEPCERCGLIVYLGEWPWCRPDGKHPEDHLR